MLNSFISTLINHSISLRFYCSIHFIFPFSRCLNFLCKTIHFFTVSLFSSFHYSIIFIMQVNYTARRTKAMFVVVLKWWNYGGHKINIKPQIVTMRCMKFRTKPQPNNKRNEASKLMDWFRIVKPRRNSFCASMLYELSVVEMNSLLYHKIFIFMFYLLNMMQYFIFNKCFMYTARVVVSYRFSVLLNSASKVRWDAALASTFDTVNHCIFNAQS